MTQKSEYRWKVRGQTQKQGAEERPVDLCLLIAHGLTGRDKEGRMAD